MIEMVALKDRMKKKWPCNLISKKERGAFYVPDILLMY